MDTEEWKDMIILTDWSIGISKNFSDDDGNRLEWTILMHLRGTSEESGPQNFHLNIQKVESIVDWSLKITGLLKHHSIRYPSNITLVVINDQLHVKHHYTLKTAAGVLPDYIMYYQCKNALEAQMIIELVAKSADDIKMLSSGLQ
jgi:hypothetical protein